MNYDQTASNHIPEVDEPRWFRRLLITLGDGKKLEVVHTFDESIVVPITTDNQILLGARMANALGRNIPVALSAGNYGNRADPSIVAAQAFRKLSIPGLDRVNLKSTGKFNSWKYLTSTAHPFYVDLNLSSKELAQVIHINDPKTTDYSTISEEGFRALTASGEISDLRTIVAVELALAARKGGASRPAKAFTGDRRLLKTLRSRPSISGSRFIEESIGQDWFPRRGEVILNSSSQAQVIATEGDGSETKILFLIEPFFAQGRYTLTLPSGSVPKIRTGERKTVMNEVVQETGYVVTDVEPLTTRRYPMPLYLTVGSTVYRARIVGKGKKEGGDESPAEEGFGVLIPVTEVGWYMREGYITDASVFAALCTWSKQNGVEML